MKTGLPRARSPSPQINSVSYARPGPVGELPGFGVPGFDPGLDMPGFEPGLGVPGLVEPGLVEPGLLEPGFVEPGLVDPGAVGLAFGVVPGVVLFGDVVGGCVVLFGVLGFVGFDPGVLGDGVAPVGGAVVLPVGG
jgi:GLTT repeat (6 copies)